MDSKIKKKIPAYSTIQIDSVIKTQISQYCDFNGLKIGRFVEKLFMLYISNSLSGSYMGLN